MSEASSEIFGVIDLFGHSRIAGQISDHTLGGESFVRVDVPQVGEIPGHTRLFGKNAIYSISFTGREVAESVARKLRSKPIEVFDFDEATRSRLSAVTAVPAITQQSIHDEDDDDVPFDDPDDSDITRIG